MTETERPCVTAAVTKTKAMVLATNTRMLQQLTQQVISQVQTPVYPILTVLSLRHKQRYMTKLQQRGNFASKKPTCLWCQIPAAAELPQLWHCQMARRHGLSCLSRTDMPPGPGGRQGGLAQG